MTRSEWKARYPNLQERYLAFCAANDTPPESWEANTEFITFINRAAAGFCLERKISDNHLGLYAAEFTDWLWEHGRDYIEAQI